MRATLALAAAAVLAAAPARAGGDPKQKPTEDEARAAGSTLVLAFDHDESSYLSGVMAAKVTVVNLAFDDVACNKAFGRGKKRTVTKKQHAKLATCLLGARWRPSSTQQAPAVVELVGGAWRLAIDDAEISGARTEITLRSIKGGMLKIERIARVEEVEEIGGVVGGDFGLEGGVEGGVVGGVLGGPPPPPPPPPPPAPPQNVAPTTLEAFRLTGDKLISPDDATKTEIQDSGKEKLVASFKLCLGLSGQVASVKLLKSSGFPDYDAKLTRVIETTWSYKPFMVNGRVVPVCTAVTFIYSQK